MVVLLVYIHIFQNIEPYAGQKIELFSSDSENDEVSIVGHAKFYVTKVLVLQMLCHG